MILTLATAGLAKANDIYVAQSALGGNTGTDCSNAKAYTFFSSSSNWGTALSQIGPGSTVHICGTITAGNGATSLLSREVAPAATRSRSNGNPEQSFKLHT